MKKIIIFSCLFIVYTVLIKTCSSITLWDKSVIIFVQNLFKVIPVSIPLLPDCKLYSIMIGLPLILGTAYFIKIRKIKYAVFICLIPLCSFLVNCIVKFIVQRQRPDYIFQIAIHPHSYSFVSSHSLVTFCLYTAVAFFINKYCTNSFLKIFIITCSILWILFVGISRIWLGVHYPTDVIGAYFLGGIFMSVCHKFYERAKNE